MDKRGNPRYELVGNVFLANRKDISDLGNLVRVDGYLGLQLSSIQSLGNLEYVGGGLDLRKTQIKSLENLEYVGDYLNLYGTTIKSLKNLQYVGGTIFLSKDHQIPEEQLIKFKFNYW